MMLARNLIEQGPAVRSCVCYLTCNRENGDKNKEKKKSYKKSSEPQTLKILTAGKHKIANTRLVEGGVDIADTEGVRGCDGILVKLIKEEPGTEKAEKPSWLVQICCEVPN